jgi:lysophospholipase L1-like esterase
LEAVAGEIRYQHPAKRYFYMQGFQDDAVLAAIHGVDVETYRQITARFDEAARGAADELLADEAFAGMVDRLPFKAGETVLGIGASQMDDVQSWFEILRHMLEIRRGADGIQMVNMAVSGQTSTDALRYFPGYLGMIQPKWVFCGIDGNDLTRLTALLDRTLVSVADAEGNKLAMRSLAADPSIGWVWLNQWPADEERIAENPNFRMGGASWRNADIEVANRFYAAQPEPVVDLHTAFGDPAGSPLLEEDGLHPSLEGHKVSVRAVVETLAG